MAERDFPPELFFNPSGADRGMKALHEMFIRSGSRFTIPEFSAALLRGLKGSADPDLALTGFLRFVGTAFGTATLFNDLLQYPAYLDLLFRLFGSSQYFADVLVREPGLFRWLTSTDALAESLATAPLRSEIERIFETFRRPEKRLDALKRLHRREMLRVGAQDLLGSADIPSVTSQLSVLAGEVVEAVLRISAGQMEEPGEPPPGGAFCIVGLGKLGGNELNYSSDIDIIFVYGARAGVSAAGEAGMDQYFNRLAGRIIRNLSQPSAEGHLYRVDTRLRPNAGAGALALSVENYVAHYESRGEIWERQMLIKARPVAGDIPFGREFLRTLEPFIYPRALAEKPAASIARIKSRIEADVAGEPNIKLMAGGIRDIEFIVQALQLINGGSTPAVRQTSTLRALRALEEHRLLTAPEHTTLREAYTLFRTIEHRLQMMLNTQTHTLPRDARAFEVLARRSGFTGAADLRRSLDARLGAVRNIFDQVLGGGEEQPASGVDALFAGGMDERSSVRWAASLGFRDVQGAANYIRLLWRGGVPAGMMGSDPRARDALASVAPVLFRGIISTPDPDLTLASLTLLAGAQPLPHLFYAQLREPGFRNLVLTICSSSPRIARALGREPLLLELISSDRESLEAFFLPPPPAPADTPAFKTRNEVVAAVRHLLGFTDFDTLTAEISAIASAIVASSFAAASGGGKKSAPPLAVFALGKLGTGEMGFDSDVDLFFVAGGGGNSSLQAQEKMAARVLAGVTSSPAGERLYEADVRLRPEGKSAPLVVEASSYAKYIAARASLWERQSLTRLRFVAGDLAVGGYISSLVSSWVYASPLPERWSEDIVAMRRSMEGRTSKRAGGRTDLKLGPGGMADIEFIVQMIQLGFGGEHTEIRGKTVGSVLKGNWLPPGLPGDPAFLASAYGMYRRLELIVRLGLEERGSLLPAGEKLHRLARLYDGSTGPALGARVSATMKRVRREFTEIAGFLGAGPGVPGGRAR